MMRHNNEMKRSKEAEGQSIRWKQHAERPPLDCPFPYIDSLFLSPLFIPNYISPFTLLTRGEYFISKFFISHTTTISQGTYREIYLVCSFLANFN